MLLPRRPLPGLAQLAIAVDRLQEYAEVALVIRLNTYLAQESVGDDCQRCPRVNKRVKVLSSPTVSVADTYVHIECASSNYHKTLHYLAGLRLFLRMLPRPDRLDECLVNILKRVRYGGDDLGGAAWTALGLGLLSHSGPPDPIPSTVYQTSVAASDCQP